MPSMRHVKRVSAVLIWVDNRVSRGASRGEHRGEPGRREGSQGRAPGGEPGRREVDGRREGSQGRAPGRGAEHLGDGRRAEPGRRKRLTPALGGVAQDSHRRFAGSRVPAQRISCAVARDIRGGLARVVCGRGRDASPTRPEWAVTCSTPAARAVAGQCAATAPRTHPRRTA